MVKPEAEHYWVRKHKVSSTMPQAACIRKLFFGYYSLNGHLRRMLISLLWLFRMESGALQKSQVAPADHSVGPKCLNDSIEV